MEDGLRPSEKAVGLLGLLAALGLLLLAFGAGPGGGCPTSTPATGLCAMAGSFQAANAARRVAYAWVGFAVLIVGAILITWPSPPRRFSRVSCRTERGLGVAVVAMALLGIVLLGATVAVGYSTPPTRTLTFANDQLPSVGGLYEPYYGTQRAATIYLTAGEGISASATVLWYASGSTTPQYGIGGLGPMIEPAGQPLVFNGSFADWFVAPQSGAYTIYFDSMYPGYATSYTSSASLTVTAYNLAFYPTVQLAMAYLGGISFAAAVGVDWVLHPRWPVRRAPHPAQ